MKDGTFGGNGRGTPDSKWINKILFLPEILIDSIILYKNQSFKH